MARLNIWRIIIWHVADTPSVLLCVFTNHINNMR